MQCVHYTLFQAQQIELESVNNDEDVVATLVSIYNCTKYRTKGTYATGRNDFQGYYSEGHYTKCNPKIKPGRGRGIQKGKFINIRANIFILLVL